jgi:hypothetical protein
MPMMCLSEAGYHNSCDVSLPESKDKTVTKMAQDRDSEVWISHLQGR